MNPVYQSRYVAPFPQRKASARDAPVDHDGDVPAKRRPSARFTDPAVSLYALAEYPVHVVCPGCRGHAEVAPWLGDQAPDRYSDRWPRRLSCRACGHVRDSPGAGPVTYSCQGWGGPSDPYFHQPLWLRERCCGQTLWAFNEAHLDVLEGYVGARLRERGDVGGLTMLARLPGWLKSAKNRGEILRVIDRLRATLPRPAGS